MSDWSMGLAQDAHDHPRCDRCGDPTWTGDIIERDGLRLCPQCHQIADSREAGENDE